MSMELDRRPVPERDILDLETEVTRLAELLDSMMSDGGNEQSRENVEMAVGNLRAGLMALSGAFLVSDATRSNALRHTAEFLSEHDEYLRFSRKNPAIAGEIIQVLSEIRTLLAAPH